MLSSTDLATVITTDPGQIGCSPTKGDQANADLLNAVSANRTATNPLVPLSQLGIWAAKNDVRKKIAAAAADATSPVQSVCQVVIDLLQGLSGPPFDVSNQDNQTMIASLVAAGILTAAQQTSLLTLANQSPASYAEVRWGAGTLIETYMIRDAFGRAS
ncbi:MAG TPA: hypothetical protein VFW87_09490 [Pirellulales bacterium]|nr:hypothetical protein [Pirellulales bacterium]